MRWGKMFGGAMPTSQETPDETINALRKLPSNKRCPNCQVSGEREDRYDGIHSPRLWALWTLWAVDIVAPGGRHLFEARR